MKLLRLGTRGSVQERKVVLMSQIHEIKRELINMKRQDHRAHA